MSVAYFEKYAVRSPGSFTLVDAQRSVRTTAQMGTLWYTDEYDEFEWAAEVVHSGTFWDPCRYSVLSHEDFLQIGAKRNTTKCFITRSFFQMTLGAIKQRNSESEAVECRLSGTRQLYADLKPWAALTTTLSRSFKAFADPKGCVARYRRCPFLSLQWSWSPAWRWRGVTGCLLSFWFCRGWMSYFAVPSYFHMQRVVKRPLNFWEYPALVRVILRELHLQAGYLPNRDCYQLISSLPAGVRLTMLADCCVPRPVMCKWKGCFLQKWSYHQWFLEISK